MKPWRFKLASLTALAFSLLFILSPLAHAATPDIGAAAQSLQISPTIINLNADKNNTYLIRVSVTNETAHDLSVTGAIDDFAAKDETGTPRILTNFEEQSESPTVSFKAWTQPIGKFVLASHASKTVDVTAAVPAKAESGGHYGVIRFTGAPTSPHGQGVGLNASLGSLVLVRVSGNISERLSVASFYAAKNSKKIGIVQNGPVTFVTRFENIGNIHVEPTGLITVTNMLGKTTASLPISNDPGNVLPDSIRRFEQTLNKKWLFGKYSVTLNATYGQTNKTISATTSFWVIPYTLIIIVLLALAALILVLRKLIKGYNRRLIEKHAPLAKPTTRSQIPVQSYDQTKPNKSKKTTAHAKKPKHKNKAKNKRSPKKKK